MILILILAALLLSSCGHPKQARVDVPEPPPPIAGNEETAPPSATRSSRPDTGDENTAVSSSEHDLAEPTLPPDAKAVATETGLASWYGPPYHNRRGSNGEVYNMHAMTAAHRTYPLGSIARVTNVKTGKKALVRITDRGPFIKGRVLDLSLAAARKLDVWQPGVAEVRVELMQAPSSATTSGRWAVQIGGFRNEGAARKLAGHLAKRYRTAHVLSFASPAGDWWVRVRVLDDEHDRAKKLAAETATQEGGVFLVRLD
jgi:rare lipoprotein A